jgi:hypothetical protein
MNPDEVITAADINKIVDLAAEKVPLIIGCGMSNVRAILGALDLDSPEKIDTMDTWDMRARAAAVICVGNLLMSDIPKEEQKAVIEFGKALQVVMDKKMTPEDVAKVIAKAKGSITKDDKSISDEMFKEFAKATK